MGDMKKITCPNCGAAIYENEPKCPFCDYINITGAEEKFMRDVKQTEEDMSQIPELQKEELKKTVSKKSKVIIVTIAIVAGVALAVSGLKLAYEAWEDSRYTYDVKAEMQWERENYPLLDEMYEAGDYDGLENFSGDLYAFNKKNKTNHSLANWEHYDFVTAYTNYKVAKELIQSLDSGADVNKYVVMNFVYNALWFYTRDYESEYQDYTETEIEIMEEYRTELEGYFLERFGYTNEELDQLAEQVTAEGYLDFQLCSKYTENNLERFK